jgi:hypothetical protein
MSCTYYNLFSKKIKTERGRHCLSRRVMRVRTSVGEFGGRLSLFGSFSGQAEKELHFLYQV